MLFQDTVVSLKSVAHICDGNAARVCKTSQVSRYFNIKVSLCIDVRTCGWRRFILKLALLPRWRHDLLDELLLPACLGTVKRPNKVKFSRIVNGI